MINNTIDDTVEKTLSEIREENEKDLQKLRVSLAKEAIELQKKYSVDLQNLSVRGLYDIHQKRKSLVEKYNLLVKQKLIDESDFEKKLKDDLAEYSNQIIKSERAERYISLQKEASDRRMFNKKLRKESEESLRDIKKKEEEFNLEYRNRRKKYNLEDYNHRVKLIQDEFKIQNDYIKKQRKLNKATAEEEKEYAQKLSEYKTKLAKEGFSKKEILKAVAETGGPDGDEAARNAQMQLNMYAAMEQAANAFLNNWKSLLSGGIESYQTYKSKIDTRLQGSGNNFAHIDSLYGRSIGITPWFKTQDLLDNVVKATEAGIAYNIEQRAFLETVSDKIAKTFNTFDSNLLRIIRIQQADSSASRLGMEAYLTQMLNKVFEDTSYLNSSYDTVSGNLIEAISTMTPENAVSFEYQVQKWLGSLESVGFSNQAVSAISGALGNLGSGNVQALSNSGAMQNLLVMSASRAGLSYADLLINGLDSSNTNKLLRSMVQYLQEIAKSDNKVVKSQYAQIFGMSVSDLQAVNNLQDSMDDIYESSKQFKDTIDELYSQVDSIGSRMSLGEKLANTLDNAKYSLSSTIGGNPALYALWEVTSMIEELTGGIPIPTVSVMGNTVDLNTTLTNMMRAGIVGTSTLGLIGDIISGVGSTIKPYGILQDLGIGTDEKGNLFKRKNRSLGLGRDKKSRNNSLSGYFGNSSGDDIFEETMLDADTKVDTIIETKKEENLDITLDNIHEYLVRILDPKITAIEQIIASIAGYESKSSSWGSFNTSDNNPYAATKVSISSLDNASGVKAQETIHNIENSTKEILDLLISVVDGNKALNIKLNKDSILNDLGEAGF